MFGQTRAIFGANGKITQTLRQLVFPADPSSLLAWCPPFNFVQDFLQLCTKDLYPPSVKNILETGPGIIPL
jgi:hypothetical protein